MSADESGGVATTIKPPWNTTQVDGLNEFQRAGLMHPFTCGKCRAVLLATPSGWICRNDDYRQQWAHVWMANPTALRALLQPTRQNAATDAHDRPGATNSPEVAGSQAAHTDAHEAPDSLGVQDRAGLGEVGA